MKTLFLFVGLLMFCSGVFAQSPQKEINDQMWKPLMAAWREPNVEAFMSLQSHDVVKTSRDDGRVMGYDEYSKVLTAGAQSLKINKFERAIELRFNERWTTNDLAYEVGVAKVQTLRPSGNNTVHYARFHITLRKENGKWKILSDSDSSEGGTLGVNDFLAAKPME